MAKPVYIFFLIAVLLIAGCTQKVNVTENDGIVIKSFIADPTDVSDFQNSVFVLDIENTGGTTARNVQPSLLGVDNVWLDYTAKSPASQMSPPDQKDNTFGDMKTFDWTLRPPDLDEGIVMSLPVKARISYDYSTSASIVIKAFDIERFRLLTNKGEKAADPVITTNTNAPVKVEFVKGPTPIIVDTNIEDELIEETYRLQIRNVGSGFPLTDNVPGKIASSSTIKLTGPGVSFKECSSGFTKTDDRTMAFSNVKLRSDGTLQLSCTINVRKADWQNRNEDLVILSFDIKYRYFAENEIKVTVRGTKRGSGPAPGGGGTVTACNGPPGSANAAVFGCTSQRASCDSNAGEGIAFTCTNGQWTKPNRQVPSECMTQCSPTATSCSTNSQKIYRCTGSSTGCSSDAGVGIPYICTSGSWQLPSGSAANGECTKICKDIGGTWPNPPPNTVTPTVTPNPTDCTAPPGDPNNVVLGCTGLRSGCASDRGEGIPFTCSSGQWTAPNRQVLSECLAQCSLAATTCSIEGQQIYRCTGNSQGCPSDAGIGVPYVCRGGNWQVENDDGECTRICKDIGTTSTNWPNPSLSMNNLCIYNQPRSSGSDICIGLSSSSSTGCRPVQASDVGGQSAADLIADTGARWCHDASGAPACTYSIGTNAQCTQDDQIDTIPCMYDKGDGSLCMGTSPHCSDDSCASHADGCGFNPNVPTGC